MSQRGVPTAAARAIVAERGAKQRGPRRRALATLAPLGALHEVVERQSDVAARAIWRRGVRRSGRLALDEMDSVAELLEAVVELGEASARALSGWEGRAQRPSPPRSSRDRR